MTRSRLTTRLSFASLIAPLLFAAPVHATTVKGIQTAFHDGQTFVTWDNLPGSGWVYHVFSGYNPLSDESSLENAQEIAQVGENSAVDARISSLLGQTYTFRIDESQPPLRDRGLVRSRPWPGAHLLHGRSRGRSAGEDRTLRSAERLRPVWERVQRPRPIWQRL
jgi:hypothetical protein